jgi:hypothetical protein
VFTVVGGTRYIYEWHNGVSYLNTPHIYVIQDDSRSEPVPKDLHVNIIHYDSGKPWQGYENRHYMYESDYSIMLGFIIGVEEFLKTQCTHAVCIDSDVIINGVVASMITALDWDYVQIGIPVIPRDKMNEPRVMPMRFWDSTNLGFSRQVISRALETIKTMLSNPYPVDINIHNAIRSVKPERSKSVNVLTLAHYIKGGKVYYKHAI